MLTITIPGDEFYDEDSETFFTRNDIALTLEHSLVSLSKWESKFEKPFLSKESKTSEEILGYIEAMILNPEYPSDTIKRLTQQNLEEINSYIDSKMSGTWFAEQKNTNQTGETITSELIYYWMTAFHIPMECETWHLTRLFNLIRIASIKNDKPKKMSKSEQIARQRELNAQRRAQMGTAG